MILFIVSIMNKKGAPDNSGTPMLCELKRCSIQIYSAIQIVTRFLLFSANG